MHRKILGSPSVYIYLDALGIEGLYAQIVERLETEYVQTRENETRGGVHASLNILKGLAGLIGLPEIVGDAEASRVGKHVEEAKMTLTTEQKLKALFDYLGNMLNEDYFYDLDRAAMVCAQSGRGVFVNGKAKFNAPQFSVVCQGLCNFTEPSIRQRVTWAWSLS